MVHLASVQSKGPRTNARSWLGFLEIRDLRPAGRYTPCLQARETIRDKCQVAVSRLSFICQSELMDDSAQTGAKHADTSNDHREPLPNCAEVAEPCCDYWLSIPFWRALGSNEMTN